MPNKTSSGEDSIPMTIVKNVISQIAQPLSFIFNTSINTSTFPFLFKTAIITPVHKKGPLSDVNNFRPISLLNNFSKILEKLVANRLSSHLERHNLLTEEQYGFRARHSTSDAVCNFIQKLDSVLSSGQHAVAVFCDLTKAFDCVDHSLLLTKLPSFGLAEQPLKWFESYLTQRQQKVKVPKSSNNSCPPNTTPIYRHSQTSLPISPPIHPQPPSSSPTNAISLRQSVCITHHNTHLSTSPLSAL